jgi:DNA polymerase-1
LEGINNLGENLNNLIIDAKNLFFISDWVSNLYTTYGQRTSAIYGSFRILATLKKKFPDAEIFFCWDKGRSPRRIAIHPEYKKREAPSEETKKRLSELHGQIPFCKDLCNALGIVTFEFEGTEADDIIASLTEILPGNKIIISSDKDFLQLISDSVSVYSTTKKIMYNYATFVESFGLYPNQWRYYRAIVGDKSDNIDGVPGFGDVRTKSILTRFNMDDILGSALDDKLLLKLRLHADKLKRNIALVTLGGDKELDSKVRAELRRQKDIKLDKEKAEQLFIKLEFNFELLDSLLV